jgi:tRNA dimethylallyltransferase
MDSILTVVGPTASGKTSYAIEQALLGGGEIISVDSRQIYRGFIIGTGQPTPKEQAQVPHHLINMLDPSERVTAGRYTQLVYEKIAEIIARGRTPILCGGTGLYVRAIRLGLKSEITSQPEVRERIQARIEREGSEKVFEELVRLDPEYAQTIHPHNMQRLIRALEIIETTGRVPSQIHGWRKSGGYEYAPTISIPDVGDVVFELIGIERPRAELNARIDGRVVEMIEAGWLDEVQQLLSSGVAPTGHPMQGVGYRQLVQTLEGELTLEKAVAIIQQRTRQFARRQVTWFRKEPVRWIAPGET